MSFSNNLNNWQILLYYFQSFLIFSFKEYFEEEDKSEGDRRVKGKGELGEVKRREKRMKEMIIIT